MRILLALCFLLSAAWAEKSVKLEFRDGKTKTQTVHGFDEAGIEVGHGDQKRRVPWEKLKPESAFKIRSELIGYDDAVARLELAEFAARLLLYPQALSELEVALALGALDEEAFEKKSKAWKDEEVDLLCARIDLRLERDDPPQECLDAIKRLKTRYPAHEANKRYAPVVPKLVAALEKEALAKKAAADNAQKKTNLTALQRQIQKLRKKYDKYLLKAKGLQKEGMAAAERWVVSRARRNLVDKRGAVDYYKRARSMLRSIARSDKRNEVVSREQLIKENDAIQKEIVACYLAAAKVYVHERSWKRAALYVRKVLLYDPINEEALELVDEIKRYRISFRVSDITNAKPRVSGG